MTHTVEDIYVQPVFVFNSTWARVIGLIPRPKMYYRPFQGDAFVVVVILLSLFVSFLSVFLYITADSLSVICWERVDLLVFRLSC